MHVEVDVVAADDGVVPHIRKIECEEKKCTELEKMQSIPHHDRICV